MASTMLNNVINEVEDYGSGFSNWLDLMLNFVYPFYEIVIVGENTKHLISELNKHYIPNKIIAGLISDKSKLKLFKYRLTQNDSLIYVCQKNHCLAPVKTINEVIKIIDIKS